MINKIMNNKHGSHIFPLYWIKGEDFKTIQITLDKMLEANIYSFILESRTHPNYLEEKWFSDIRFIIKESQKRNMKFWLFDDNHFPTGSVNGLLKTERPDLRKEVLKFIRFEILGPQTNIKYSTNIYWDETSRFHSIIATQNDTTLNLTKFVDQKENEIYFNIPEGKWDIFLIYTSRKTDFHEYHINMVDNESTDLLINEIYEKHYEEIGEHFGDTILGFFTDEPGFLNEKGNKGDSKIGKVMPLPWSRYVEVEMLRVFGESYPEILPSLWIERDDSPNVRVKYMNIITDLYSTFFDKKIGDWCRNKGLMHIGHIIEDRDAHARLGPGVGHFFKSMLGQDMSGIDIVLNQFQPGLDDGVHTYFRGEWEGEFFHYGLVRLGTSLASIDPIKKGRTMAEVFGAFGWHEGIKLMKWIVDHFLVRGVNYFVPHAFSMAEFPDKDCPPHFYAHNNDPFFEYFKELMLYTQKMCTLFEGGKRTPKVAVLYHAESEWAGQYMEFTIPSKYLTKNLIDYDIVPTTVFEEDNPYNTDLSNSLKVNGNVYDYLIIPYSEYISQKLVEFIKKGNTKVIFLNDLPKGLYDSNKKIDNGIATVMSETELDAFLYENRELRGFSLSDKQDYLRYFSYENFDEKYHMFFNEHPNDYISIKIPEIEATYKVDLLNNDIYLWDGELFLHPYESVLIVETNEEYNLSINYCFEKETLVKFNFDVSYSYPTSYPNFSKSIRIDSPTDLTKLHYKNKSGIFRYKTKIKFPSENVELAIEKVSEAITLRLDNEIVGRRIVPPYNFILTGLDTEKEYDLVFEVSNTLNHQYNDILSFFEPKQPTGILSDILMRY